MVESGILDQLPAEERKRQEVQGGQGHLLLTAQAEAGTAAMVMSPVHSLPASWYQ